MVQKYKMLFNLFYSQKKGCSMKSKILSSVLCLALLNAHVSLLAEEQDATSQEATPIYLSAVEVQEIFNNPDRSYVYVGKDVSAIPQLIAEISKFDENKDSLVWSLADHIEKGFVIGNYEAVTQALVQAGLVLHKHAHELTGDKVFALYDSLNGVIQQVTANKLSLNAEMLSFLKDSLAAQENATQSEDITAA